MRIRKLTTSLKRWVTGILIYFEIIETRAPNRSRSAFSYTRIFLVLCGLSILTGEHIEDVVKWTGLDLCQVRTAEGKRTFFHWIFGSEKRKCLEKQATFILWQDANSYSHPSNKPNRNLTVTGIRPDGSVIWTESALTYTDEGHKIEAWHRDDNFTWVEVSGAQDVHVHQALSDIDADRVSSFGDTGFILRRLQITNDKCDALAANTSSVNGSRANPGNILEFYFLRAKHDKHFSVDHPGVYMRWIDLQCGDQIGTSMRLGASFRPLTGWLVDAESD